MKQNDGALVYLAFFGFVAYVASRASARGTDDLPVGITRDWLPFTGDAPSSARADQSALDQAVTDAIRARAARNVATSAGRQSLVDNAVATALANATGSPTLTPAMAMQDRLPPDTDITARSPLEAATALQGWLVKTKRWGSAKDRPNEIKAAQQDLHVEPDGIVGPATRAACEKLGISLPRSPREAAEALRNFLVTTRRFGSKTDHPPEVTDAQSDLGVQQDGIVGPATRMAARRQGVTLPAK
jgi:peptidoglycan hydrolase-like protein with peptidoglycan-binding domain